MGRGRSPSPLPYGDSTSSPRTNRFRDTAVVFSFVSCLKKSRVHGEGVLCLIVDVIGLFKGEQYIRTSLIITIF